MRHLFWSLVAQLGRLLVEVAERRLVHAEPWLFPTKPKTLVEEMQNRWGIW